MNRDRMLTLEMAGDVKEGLGSGSQFPKRGHQAVRLELHRTKPPGQMAGLGDCFVDEGGNFGRFGGLAQ